MRPAELTWLAWEDVDLTLRTVKVQAKPEWKPKNLTERTIPLGREATEVLESLHRERSGPWAFGIGDKPMKSIRRSLQTAARSAGITKKITR